MKLPVAPATVGWACLVVMASSWLPTTASAQSQSGTKIVRFDDFAGQPVDAQCAQAPKVTKADFEASLAVDNWVSLATDLGNMLVLECVARKSELDPRLASVRRERIERAYPESWTCFELTAEKAKKWWFLAIPM